jgi:hypothetical protein
MTAKGQKHGGMPEQKVPAAMATQSESTWQLWSNVGGLISTQAAASEAESGAELEAESGAVPESERASDVTEPPQPATASAIMIASAAS